MSALTDAVAGFATALQGVAGETVTYSRQSSQITGLSGVPDNQDYEVVDAEGFASVIPSYDWLVTATDLVLSGSAIVPRPGDRISGMLNGVAMVFEVMPIGTKPACEPVDPDGLMLLVHSKRVS